jgi:hypothetical protein
VTVLVTILAAWGSLVAVLLLAAVAVGDTAVVTVGDRVGGELRVHGRHCARDLAHGAGDLAVVVLFEASATGAAARRTGHGAPVAPVIAADSLDAAGPGEVALRQLVVLGGCLAIGHASIRHEVVWVETRVRGDTVQHIHVSHHISFSRGWEGIFVGGLVLLQVRLRVGQVAGPGGVSTADRAFLEVALEDIGP